MITARSDHWPYLSAMRAYYNLLESDSFLRHLLIIFEYLDSNTFTPYRVCPINMPRLTCDCSCSRCSPAITPTSVTSPMSGRSGTLYGIRDTVHSPCWVASLTTSTDGTTTPLGDSSPASNCTPSPISTLYRSSEPSAPPRVDSSHAAAASQSSQISW